MIMKETLVNIIGEKPNIKMQILDNKGNIRNFRIVEMLLDNRSTEIDYSKKEYNCAYYKGRVELVERFLTRNKTYMFKYIPSKRKWFICGDTKELFDVKTHKTQYDYM